MKVLVVDDSATVRNEVSGFLNAQGIANITANDGAEGIKLLQANPSVKLVISDVNMPVIDGLTMAEKIRGDLNNQEVNIIMLTTESDPRMKARGKAAGVKGWIVKPFNGSAVVGAIQKLIA